MESNPALLSSGRVALALACCALVVVLVVFRRAIAQALRARIGGVRATTAVLARSTSTGPAPAATNGAVEGIGRKRGRGNKVGKEATEATTQNAAVKPAPHMEKPAAPAVAPAPVVRVLLCDESLVPVSMQSSISDTHTHTHTHADVKGQGKEEQKGQCRSRTQLYARGEAPA
jgi:hypothetical protein